MSARQQRPLLAEGWIHRVSARFSLRERPASPCALRSASATTSSRSSASTPVSFVPCVLFQCDWSGNWVTGWATSNQIRLGHPTSSHEGERCGSARPNRPPSPLRSLRPERRCPSCGSAAGMAIMPPPHITPLVMAASAHPSDRPAGTARATIRRAPARALRAAGNTDRAGTHARAARSRPVRVARWRELVLSR
jgi:hypothetical protein